MREGRQGTRLESLHYYNSNYSELGTCTWLKMCGECLKMQDRGIHRQGSIVYHLSTYLCEEVNHANLCALGGMYILSPPNIDHITSCE